MRSPGGVGVGDGVGTEDLLLQGGWEVLCPPAPPPILSGWVGGGAVPSLPARLPAQPWEGRWPGRKWDGAAPQSSCSFISEEGAYDEYENDLGVTATALYDYQAGEQPPRPRGGGASAAHVASLN